MSISLRLVVSAAAAIKEIHSVSQHSSQSSLSTDALAQAKDIILPIKSNSSDLLQFFTIWNIWNISDIGLYDDRFLELQSLFIYIYIYDYHWVPKYLKNITNNLIRQSIQENLFFVLLLRFLLFVCDMVQRVNHMSSSCASWDAGLVCCIRGRSKSNQLKVKVIWVLETLNYSGWPLKTLCPVTRQCATPCLWSNGDGRTSANLHRPRSYCSVP